MADPVVHITNGVPDGGTGNITTLGQVLAALPAALGAGGGLKVDGSGTALPVSGTFWQATQPVSGTFWQATQPVSLASVPSHAVTNAGTFAVQVTSAPSTVVTNGGTFAVQNSAATPAGTNVIGAVLSAASATANGTSSSRINSAASTNATSLKASAGQAYELDVFNNAAYAVFLKFYNKASAPTVGTDTPIWTVPIPSGGGFSRSFPRGKTFSIGIAYAITKLQADSDTTVVVAGDLTGSIDWI